MNLIDLPILKGLSDYRDERVLRFHMPGHYGRASFPELEYLAENMYEFDVTEEMMRFRMRLFGVR